MKTTDTSLLSDLLDNAAKRRRFYMLPIYSRVIVIVSSILGSLFTLSATFYLFKPIFTELVFSLPATIFNLTLVLLALTFCLGNAFIWAEKKDAIGLGQAACICGMFFSFAFIGIQFANNLLLLFICPLPLIILYALLYIKLKRIKTTWKTEGASLRELRKLRKYHSSSAGTIA